MEYCTVCRRKRSPMAVQDTLACCGMEIVLCEEVCTEMIPRVCGMSAQAYADLFRRVHERVCQQKYKM